MPNKQETLGSLPMEDFSKQPDEVDSSLPGGEPATPSMDLLVNVPMRISVELGRARMPMKNILQLSQGSVIELDKASGEPMTIYINGELFAYGEAVLVNQERFGVRLTALVNKEDVLRNPREP
ncbi:flagellar motor switch protein FliN [Acidithiobacillus ferrooxidans]|jgi:flagellar motor switch protein FliN/FliY|uniref:flagellar motor switch protein FliN n=1 Tax=Acidithiobacillus ferrooxidans TaxID=920 RepID=UPI00214BE823|nr:flagellar motor switch protein FliN [Acidithiobacillus ferrooxidans]MCR2831265.1 flagellar motor switch protein FliN [Acidithiobacillus ferrooxidans]MDA8153553.1 flagellar motor switch protein FliN [Acidithiobacillus sp.]